MSEVKAECSACKGTGIYRGFAEPAGVGVVCLECGGSGCKVITYTPFERRKTRNDIQIVHLSRGSLLALGVGPAGGAVTYQDFLNGQMPRRV